MITIDNQQKLFMTIAKRLKKKITVYAIGGTAMMFYGYKDATKDIDLVFESEEERSLFEEAIGSLGYQKMDALQVYGVKRNQPHMFTLGDERFDLFVIQVIDFIFSKNMQKRAEQVHQFGDTLFLALADAHDLILMKCATDRLKDKDDVRTIISSTKISWNVLIEEAQHQIQLGKERAAFELGCFLEDLKNQMKIKIPKKVLDDLFTIVEKQAREKKR